jgi:hypothetical protein
MKITVYVNGKKISGKVIKWKMSIIKKKYDENVQVYQ